VVISVNQQLPEDGLVGPKRVATIELNVILMTFYEF
jgi:hypothetical protein